MKNCCNLQRFVLKGIKRTSAMGELNIYHFTKRVYPNCYQKDSLMANEHECSDILRYKSNTTNKYRPGLSDNEKRNIRDKATRYVIEKELLYVEVLDKSADIIRKRRVVVKEANS